MEAFKNSDYNESQKDFLLGLKSELEGLRGHIGFVSRHGTEDMLIHRIIARVILQNKNKKAGKEKLVFKLSIDRILAIDKQAYFKGKPILNKKEQEYFEPLLEFVKTNQEILGTNPEHKIEFCISWLIELITKEDSMTTDKLPPFLKDSIHHDSPASVSSSATKSPSPSKTAKNLTGRFGPSPKAGKRIEAGGKKKGRKTYRVSRKYRR